MSEQFYSEFGEDAWVSANLPLLPRGVYVDVGAAYPLLRSNTAFLRNRGWTGIAIDGNPVYQEQWPESQLISAVVSRKQDVCFECHGAPDLSGIRPEGEPVNARTLESILLENRIIQIDLLSLDCEGGEFDALMSMDMWQHNPTIIISEYNTFGVGEDFRVKEYLEYEGYREVHRTVANIIFTK